MKDFRKQEEPEKNGQYSNSSSINSDNICDNQSNQNNRKEEITEEEKNVVKLSSKFLGLGIRTKFVYYLKGPVVTNYTFTLSNDVPLSKVLGKSEDLALSVGAVSCIIQRIGGEIVISIPNNPEDRQIVDFKDNLYWYLHNEKVREARIPIPLGINIQGQKSFFELTDMPHALVAGSTGAGKSVWLSSIIESLVYKFDSDYVKMYLVDTKRVDLPLFKDLPHIIGLADDIKSFHSEVCYQVMGEIRHRLQLFQTESIRNIDSYKKKTGNKIPYILVIIDELADVLELDKELDRKKDGEYEGTPTVKAWLKRVTAIARAAGIHIIACTQRSSVKIIDGDIKANFNCRIALRLPTGFDSRTILGENGAENLLGKGDMLVKKPDTDILERFHGPFVRDEDIKELVENYNQLKTILSAPIISH